MELAQTIQYMHNPLQPIINVVTVHYRSLLLAAAYMHILCKFDVHVPCSKALMKVSPSSSTFQSTEARIQKLILIPDDVDMTLWSNLRTSLIGPISV
jgi:hypothetical protein